MSKRNKTCRDLYNEFCNKYSIDQTAYNQELSMVYIYLKDRCSVANGNYFDFPPTTMRELIFKHLGHQYELHQSVKKESPVLS
jgi:hypothetical protein